MLLAAQAFKEHVERQLAALRAELARLSKGADDTRAVLDTKAGLVEVRMAWSSSSTDQHGEA